MAMGRKKASFQISSDGAGQFYHTTLGVAMNKHCPMYVVLLADVMARH